MPELYRHWTSRGALQTIWISRQLATSLKSVDCKSHLPSWQVELVHFQECFCTALHGHLLCTVLQQQSPQMIQICFSMGKKIAFLCALKLLIYLQFSSRDTPAGSASSQPCSLLCRQIMQMGNKYDFEPVLEMI